MKTNKVLLVQYHDHNDFTHFRLHLDADKLHIQLGKAVGGVFVGLVNIAIKKERLPEIEDLHDGVAWNVFEVARLLDDIRIVPVDGRPRLRLERSEYRDSDVFRLVEKH
jgi:hypothetical protein